MKNFFAPLSKHRKYYGVFCFLYAIFFAGLLFKYGKLQQNALNFLLVYLGIPLLIAFFLLFIEKQNSKNSTV